MGPIPALPSTSHAFNGFIFRIVQDDLPARFDDWATDGLIEHGLIKPRMFHSVEQLDVEFCKVVAFRIGEELWGWRGNHLIWGTQDDVVVQETIEKTSSMYAQ